MKLYSPDRPTPAPAQSVCLLAPPRPPSLLSLCTPSSGWSAQEVSVLPGHFPLASVVVVVGQCVSGPVILGHYWKVPNQSLWSVPAKLEFCRIFLLKPQSWRAASLGAPAARLVRASVRMRSARTLPDDPHRVSGFSAGGSGAAGCCLGRLCTGSAVALTA